MRCGWRVSKSPGASSGRPRPEGSATAGSRRSPQLLREMEELATTNVATVEQAWHTVPPWYPPRNGVTDTGGVQWSLLHREGAPGEETPVTSETRVGVGVGAAHRPHAVRAPRVPGSGLGIRGIKIPNPSEGRNLKVALRGTRPKGGQDIRRDFRGAPWASAKPEDGVHRTFQAGRVPGATHSHPSGRTSPGERLGLGAGREADGAVLEADRRVRRAGRKSRIEVGDVGPWVAPGCDGDPVIARERSHALRSLDYDPRVPCSYEDCRQGTVPRAKAGRKAGRPVCLHRTDDEANGKRGSEAVQSRPELETGPEAAPATARQRDKKPEPNEAQSEHCAGWPRGRAKRGCHDRPCCREREACVALEAAIRPLSPAAEVGAKDTRDRGKKGRSRARKPSPHLTSQPRAQPRSPSSPGAGAGNIVSYCYGRDNGKKNQCTKEQRNAKNENGTQRKWAD